MPEADKGDRGRLKVTLKKVNSSKLKRIVEYAESKGREIILLTDLSDDGEGVLRLREGEHKVVIVHG